MERDIRDLFKENEVSDKEIPQFHREEFTKKLNELNQKSNKNNLLFLSAALVLSLLLK